MNRARVTYLAAVAAAAVAAVFPIYIQLAVGVVDPPGGPIVWMQLGVVALGVVAAIVGGFHARGMARALVVAAIAQALVAVLELTAVPAHPASPPVEILGVNAVFVGLFLGSAWLFGRAARKPGAGGAESAG